jgi:hypothetical protein
VDSATYPLRPYSHFLDRICFQGMKLYMKLLHEMYWLGENTEYFFQVHVCEINYWLTYSLIKIQVITFQRDI